MCIRDSPNATVANNPKITEGISANNSIAIRISFWKRIGIRYLINNDDLIPIGAAIKIAIPAERIVTHNGNQTLASPLFKSNLPVKMMLVMPKCSNPGIAA